MCVCVFLDRGIGGWVEWRVGWPLFIVFQQLITSERVMLPDAACKATRRRGSEAAKCALRPRNTFHMRRLGATTGGGKVVGQIISALYMSGFSGVARISQWSELEVARGGDITEENRLS